MIKHLAVTTLFLLIALTGLAQHHLPRFKYSKAPAVLNARIVGDFTQVPEDVKVIYTLKYSDGMGNARKGKKAQLDENGCCSLSLPTGTTVSCNVIVGEHDFNCYVVPGDTVSFTLDLCKLGNSGKTEAISFQGALADFNHDLVYAQEQGFDPYAIYLGINMKQNSGKLAAELSECSVDGYFQYLDSVYQHINDRINADRTIGGAYREFAQAVNRYGYGEAVPSCAYSIRHTGLDTEEKYLALLERQINWLEDYLRDDPWSAPALSYVMFGEIEDDLQFYIKRPVKIPEDYRQCNLTSRYLQQMGQRSELLSEAQKDSVRIYLPELGQDVLDYNERLEKELAFINDQGKSRICTLSEGNVDASDVLSAILKPYRGRPVLLDLWETTCGPCRMAFKNMHDKKIELADRIHFVNIASEHSDRATWERLVPNYIGDHYFLTEEQLKALHSQLPCDTNGVPIWVVVNADGTIHHAFTGWGNLELMMNELEPVL